MVIFRFVSAYRTSGNDVVTRLAFSWRDTADAHRTTAKPKSGIGVRRSKKVNTLTPYSYSFILLLTPTFGSWGKNRE